MKKFLYFIFSLLMILVVYHLVNRPVYAVQYDLIAPTGQLTRGSDIQFTVTIDTQGETVNSVSIGMVYDKSVLQYEKTDAGNTFTAVIATQSDGGPGNVSNASFSQPANVIFNATSDAGYSGSGNFAVVTFKLIATAPGSTNLCVLFNPTSSPTAAPTTPVAAPTALPRTGAIDQTNQGAVAGIAFLLAAGVGAIIGKKITSHHHRRLHK